IGSLATTARTAARPVSWPRPTLIRTRFWASCSMRPAWRPRRRLPMTKLTVLVSGMIAAVPWQGGATWAVLQYLLGFKRLGHDVFFVEPLAEAALQPAGASLERSTNAAYFHR